jgi:hypothetical protein
MILLILGGYEQVALENLALREQLGIFQRSVLHAKIRPMDRLFGVCLRKVWKEWRSALVIVRPETVPDWPVEALQTLLVPIIPAHESRPASDQR